MESSKSPPIYKGLPTIPMDPDSMLLPGNYRDFYQLSDDPEYVKKVIEHYKLEDGCLAFVVISHTINISGNNEKLKERKGVICRFVYKEGKTATLIGDTIGRIVGFSTSSDSVFRVDAQVVPDRDCSEYFAKNRQTAYKILQEVAGNLGVIIRRSSRFNKVYKTLKFRIIPESLKSVVSGIKKISIDDEDFIAQVSDAVNEAIYCLPVVLKHEKQKFIDVDYLPDRLDLCKFIITQKTLFFDQLIGLREEKDTINAFVAMFGGSSSKSESIDLDENRFGPDHPEEVRSLWATYLAKRAHIPEDAQKVIMEDFERLGNPSPHGLDSTGRSFFERLSFNLHLPWGVIDPTNSNIDDVARILDEDHEGLSAVKEVIREFVTPFTIDPESATLKGDILCFVGPPGVGKTSLGKSIARALGRKFVKMSLGGVADEASIRGHRVTYIGAKPGKVLSLVSRCGSMNPVIQFDEIDKLGLHMGRDDVSSALLEVLDSEHNHAFIDHYSECPFSLSRAFFVCTANVLESMPDALRDRMKIVRLPGYLDYQKAAIARKFLCPKWQRDLPFAKLNLEIKIEEEVLLSIINSYTGEAGVRNLDQYIQRIYRKIMAENSQRTAESERLIVNVGVGDLQRLLGIPKHINDVFIEPRIGEMTGLAWTAVGGVRLRVQVKFFKTKGDIVISHTGSQKDVMRESTKTALTLLKNMPISEGARRKLEEMSVEVHLSESAIPKDGPSAGITTFLTLLSEAEGLLPASEVAMTGEIDLQERVLAIGGVQEKLIAAKRFGIKRVIFPRQNKRDIDGDVEERAKEGIEILFVDTVREAMRIVFPDYKPA